MKNYKSVKILSNF